MSSSSKALLIGSLAIAVGLGGYFYLPEMLGHDADVYEEQLEELAGGPGFEEAGFDSRLIPTEAVDGSFEEENSLTDEERVAIEIIEAATPAPRDRLRVTGRVLDPSGGPLAKAEVKLFSRPSHNLVQQLYRGRQRGPQDRFWRRAMRSSSFGKPILTKADGSFEVEADTYTDCRLEVTAQHQYYAPTVAAKAWKLSEGTLSFGDIKLDPGGAVLGQVIDNEGAPIPRAKVSYRSQTKDWTTRQRIQELIPPIETDDLGKFKIAGLPEGHFRVTVEAAKFIPSGSKRFEIKGGNDVAAGEIKLILGAELAGVVRDPDGGAIAMADVEVRYAGPSRADWAAVQKLPKNKRKAKQRELQMKASRFRGRPKRVKTDREGRFQMDSLPLGDLRVSLKHPKFIDEQIARVDPEKQPVVEVEMDRRLAAAGVVLDLLTNRPLASFGIKARRIRGLPNPTPRKPTNPSIQRSRPSNPVASTRGTKRNATRRPSRNQKPQVRPQQKAGARNRSAQNRRTQPRPQQDAQAKRSAQKRQAQKRSGQKRPTPKRTQPKRANPRPKSAAQIKREQDRERVKQQKLAEKKQRDLERKQRDLERRAKQKQERAYSQNRIGGSGIIPGATPRPSSHKDGKFNLLDLQPGVYVFDVGAQGYVKQAAGPFTIEKGKQLAPVTIRLEKGRFIAGIVRNRRTGNPIQGARVELYLPRLNQPQNAAAMINPLFGAMRGQNLGRRLARVETSKTGEFRFDCQKPGKFTLRAMAQNHSSFVDRNLVLLGGQDITHKEIVLGLGAEIQGTVRGLEENERATVILASTKGARRFAPVDQKTGKYEAKGLEAGDYFVRLNRPGKRGGMMTQLIEAVSKPGGNRPDVRLVEGATRRFDLNAKNSILGSIEGKLVLNGRPGANLAIQLEPVTNPMQKLAPGDPMRWVARAISSLGNAQSKRDGTFKIESLPQGIYNLRVSRKGRGSARVLHLSQLTIHGSTPTRLTLQLITGKLQLKSLSSKDGKPVRNARVILVLASEALGKDPKQWRGLKSLRTGSVRRGKGAIGEMPVGDYRYLVIAGGFEPLSGQCYVGSVGSVLDTRLKPRGKAKRKPRGTAKPGAKKGAGKGRGKPGAGKGAKGKGQGQPKKR